MIAFIVFPHWLSDCVEELSRLGSK